MRRIDQCASRGRGQHAGDAAQRHDGPDRIRMPAVRLQENAEKRPDARLHVRHEEVQPF